MEYIISKNLKEKFLDFGHPITERLANLKSIPEGSKKAVSYLDFSVQDSKEEKISFIDRARLKKCFRPIVGNTYSPVKDSAPLMITYVSSMGDWFELEGLSNFKFYVSEEENSPNNPKMRYSSTIGRIVVRMFPGEYSDKEIEDLTNSWKSFICDVIFELVKGEEILEYYSGHNETFSGGESKLGTLYNSCMRGLNEGTFDIYTKNPEIELLVIKYCGEPVGRALVFTDVEGQKWLERVYASDSNILAAVEYAKEQGWGHRIHHNASDFKYNLNGETIDPRHINIKLSNPQTAFFSTPYMDTFKYMTADGRLFRSKKDISDIEGFYIFGSTSGGSDFYFKGNTLNGCCDNLIYVPNMLKTEDAGMIDRNYCVPIWSKYHEKFFATTAGLVNLTPIGWVRSKDKIPGLDKTFGEAYRELNDIPEPKLKSKSKKAPSIYSSLTGEYIYRVIEDNSLYTTGWSGINTTTTNNVPEIPTIDNE